MNGRWLRALLALLACAACLASAQAEPFGSGWFAPPSQTPAPTAMPPAPVEPQPTAAPQATITLPALQRGDRGGAVRCLQRTLIELGYLSGSADGDYGGQTEQAVLRAQAMAGLPATGVAGGDFLAALYSGAVPDATGAPARLSTRVVAYSATSQHSDKYGSYSVDNAFDGRLDTTWCEDAAGNGEGEGISFTVATFGQTSITLDIFAGYQKKAAIYRNNGRPRDIRLTVDGRDYDYTLSDSMSAQSFILPNASANPFMELDLTILSVYPGEKWKDTCICDIQVR